jgi:hypothetical protein
VTAFNSRRLVGAGLASDANPGEPLSSCNHLSLCLRRQEDELARPELILVAIDADGAAATNDELDLFLTVPPMVVNRSFGLGCQLELVESERAHSENLPYWAEGAVDVHVAPF